MNKRWELDRFLTGVERRAFRIAVYAVGNPDDALEIVQEAMLKLCERYADKSASDWTPLFYRILNSRINDFHRRNTVRKRWRVFLGREDDDAPGDPLENQPDAGKLAPEVELSDEQMTDELEACLKNLPLRQQQAFLLRAWEGLDVAATATAMGCSSGSVKTHYSRAIAKLRDALQVFAP